MSASPDMSVFTSRLHLKGTLVFDSAYRIGAEQSLAVDAPDLPVLKTVDGLPYIPGSSFKGAWRAYTESILRTIQSQPGVQQHNLACLTISEPCLPDTAVKEIKAQANADALLREQSCWTCRVFGNGQLAAKVLIKDLRLDTDSFIRTEVRDGVAIDRDSARAADKFKYRFEAVPAGAKFHLEVLVENASAAELGLVMLGLRSFERGEVLLGGAKSRGLGWCHLEKSWPESSRFVGAKQLLTYLLETADSTQWSPTEQIIQGWLKAFQHTILEA